VTEAPGRSFFLRFELVRLPGASTDFLRNEANAASAVVKNAAIYSAAASGSWGRGADGREFTLALQQYRDQL